MTIIEKIRKLCERDNLTIAALERKAGLANGTIGKWEDNDTGMRVKSLIAISQALDVPVSYFLEK